MSPIRHILTTTDFSPAAGPGLDVALSLARRLGAKVTVAHVFDATPFAPIATRGDAPTPQHDFAASQYATEHDVEQLVQNALDALEAERLADLPDATTALLEGGDAADAICGWAKDNAVDLIVIATHGRTGLAHLLIGSVAERVVRHAEVPVLTVRSLGA